jgi:hypothetical protein
LYEEQRATNPEIEAMLGISHTTLLVRVREWGWRRRDFIPPGRAALVSVLPASMPAQASDHGGAQGPATPPAAAAMAVPDSPDEPAAPETEIEFYARVCRGMRRQMDMIERVQTALSSAPVSQTARVLATLNKSLLEIHAVARPHDDGQDDDDDDDMPRDIEEFRRQLARRIQGLVEAERLKSGEPPDGVEPA